MFRERKEKRLRGEIKVCKGEKHKNIYGICAKIRGKHRGMCGENECVNGKHEQIAKHTI